MPGCTYTVRTPYCPGCETVLVSKATAPQFEHTCDNCKADYDGSFCVAEPENTTSKVVVGRKKDCIRCAGLDRDSPPVWTMEYNSDDANESRFGAIHDADLKNIDKQKAKEAGRQARRLLGGLPAEDYTFALIGDDDDLEVSDDARKLEGPKPKKQPRKRTLADAKIEERNRAEYKRIKAQHDVLYKQMFAQQNEVEQSRRALAAYRAIQEFGRTWDIEAGGTPPPA